MDDGTSSVSVQREQRMLAVAKLKRAASLPRMKDGRRPPMHPEGFSEGERGGTPLEDSKPDIDTPPPQEEVAEPVHESVIVPELDVEADNEDITITSATTRKRRSRSRSRSRGSKDFKGKARAAQSPTPNQLNPAGDSSQDEAPLRAVPPILIPQTDVMSPVPSNVAALHQAYILRSPTPDMSMLPYPSSPPTPLPSLEAISKNFGLFRSNSAGRMMAMHKLTGGTESYEPSPSPTHPIPGKFRRNNTVSGGERSAARKLMLDKLAGRSAKESDWEHSGGEELISPVSSPIPKRRRRRSRRSSSTNKEGISDSDFISTTSPNTPIVPPTPLPNTIDSTVDIRARSVTPSHSQTPFIMERRRRSVVVEDEDVPSAQVPPALPSGPPPQRSRLPTPEPVAIQSFDDPVMTTDSEYNPPTYFNNSRLHDEDKLASSPFTNPLKEKISLEEEEEEEVLYPADRIRSPYGDVEDRISWVASPVPQIRMPIDEDGEYGEEDNFYRDEQQPSRPSSDISPQEEYNNTSPRNSSDSQVIVIESELYPVHANSYVPPSPSSLAALSQTDDSQIYPTRLSVVSPQSELSPFNSEFPDTEDRPVQIDGTGKRSGAWEKMKNTFSRSNSSIGRRSRTNSLVKDRRDHTDSSISRESGASITGAKLDGLSQQQSQQPLSASPSYSSLSPQTGGLRGGPSPVPQPMSSPDLAQYQTLNDKLFPFPGIKKLQEQRRVRGMLGGSSSTPDINILASMQVDELSGQPLRSAPLDNRTVSHKGSDNGLMDRYGLSSPTIQPGAASIDYLNVVASPTSPTSSGKLPMTMGGVKQWLKSNKNIFSSQNNTSPSFPPISSPIQQQTGKKPSVSDLIRLRKENGLNSDWEEMGSTTPISSIASNGTLVGKSVSQSEMTEPARETTPLNTHLLELSDTERTPTIKKATPIPSHMLSPASSPPEPSSATPDPSSSLSDYPAASTSESSSNTSSHYSIAEPKMQGSIVLERLDENLARGSRSPMWASVTDDSPRKLLIASPVLQVVNPNTVKDRFLFLFNDILIITKPVTAVSDSEEDAVNFPKPDSRKFIVKSVVQLQNLRVNVDRLEAPKISPAYGTVSRPPLLRSFIHHFAKDPDHAISTLLSKSGAPDDPTVLGKLLFRTIELDRAQLGDYLSRRTSKLVLKSYLDSFGFVGLRVDRALRAFLLSIHVPPRTFAAHNHLDYLLDAFATRWQEANMGIVAYDRNMASRLVRLLVQLNNKLHGGISDEVGYSSYPRKDAQREFVSFFRNSDPGYLVPDDTLEDLYLSISMERLCQARIPDPNMHELSIIIKRSVPHRLTYRIQSEPIVIRIPQPDPHFTIQLYGQDLIFEPAVLTFAKSSEASFRVMGTSLGPRTMMMCRSGPNALKYASLPLGNIISIERAFMRNTFQIAFSNHAGVKRRYMFSVDDPLLRNEWETRLKRQMQETTASAVSPGSSKFYRAVDMMAFVALQETLIGSDASRDVSIHRVLERLGESPNFMNGSLVNGKDGRLQSHARSKSRSKVYQQSGPGRNEPSPNLFDSTDSSHGVLQSPKPDAPMWTRRELELQCLQNSSISLVLSYLQIGAPEHGQDLIP